MKKVLMLIAFVSLTSAVHAYDVPGNPDRKMSIGLNYDRENLNSEYSFMAAKISDFTKVGSNSFMADIRVPISSIFTFSVRGGYVSSTNELFTSEKVEYSGYDIGVGVRFFIN